MDEKKGAPPAERASDCSAEEQEKRDREDQLELMAGMGGVLRRGGLALGLFIALGGWYLSRDGGTWFLIGGLALGALIGGGLAISGLLGGAILKKYMGGRGKGPDDRY